MRSGGRVVEGARLESEYTAKPYRGFESLPLRHFLLISLDNFEIRSPRPGFGAGFGRIAVANRA